MFLKLIQLGIEHGTCLSAKSHPKCDLCPNYMSTRKNTPFFKYRYDITIIFKFIECHNVWSPWYSNIFVKLLLCKPCLLWINYHYNGFSKEAILTLVSRKQFLVLLNWTQSMCFLYYSITAWILLWKGLSIVVQNFRTRWRSADGVISHLIDLRITSLPSLCFWRHGDNRKA